MCCVNVYDCWNIRTGYLTSQCNIYYCSNTRLQQYCIYNCDRSYLQHWTRLSLIHVCLFISVFGKENEKKSYLDDANIYASVSLFPHSVHKFWISWQDVTIFNYKCTSRNILFKDALSYSDYTASNRRLESEKSIGKALKGVSGLNCVNVMTLYRTVTRKGKPQWRRPVPARGLNSVSHSCGSALLSR